MLKKLVAVALVALPLSSAFAAHHESKEGDIIAVIDAFFNMMATRNTENWEDLALPDGMIFAARDTADGSATLTRISLQAFVENLTPGGPALLERMWEPEAKIHGAIATVWAPYDLHVDGQFSHCGIDSFQMIRDNGQWKIANVIYTAQTEGCAPSPQGPVE